MIQRESVNIKGKEFIRTYSDAGCYVVRDGISYSEAVDPAEFNRQYTEGEPMEEYTSEIEEKAAAYDILMGGGS